MNAVESSQPFVHFSDARTVAATSFTSLLRVNRIRGMTRTVTSPTKQRLRDFPDSIPQGTEVPCDEYKHQKDKSGYCREHRLLP